ncbi:MAG: amidase, partial [Thermoleophilaceae bacterium]|nr:amidase [Thermoleophilaceae bacterium]
MGYDATGLAELVASKQVTAAELLELARKRAAEVNPKTNAIVIPIDKEADAQVADGATPAGAFGGVPFLIKDLAQEYRGYPTTMGSRALKNFVADEHALVVDRFLAAGLVIFGKTNTPEFGAKGITESELWGPCRNPWDLGRTPGGSSGGSASAVASGIVPAAGANDGGGSIRIPAGCNGLVGLKPSRGLAPYGPQTNEPMFGMAVQGVVTRTVRDNAGIFDTIIGHTAHSDYNGELPSVPFAELIKSAPGKLKIGYSAKSAITDKPDPEAVKALETTAQLLTELGHEVEEIDPPYDDKALAADFLTIWFAQVAGGLALAREETGAKYADFEPDTLAMAELGRSNGVVEAAKAMAHNIDYIRAISDFHEKYDYFLTPTIARKPVKIGELATSETLQKGARFIHAVRGGKLLLKSGIMEEMIIDNLGWVPYTQMANLTGRPAINVPVYWTDDGMPLGVQFNGRLGSDGALLQLAAQLEEARPWAQRHPAPVK